jgi:hypothetical protein
VEVWKFPYKNRFNWLSSIREEDFQKLTNLKQELPVAAMFANKLAKIHVVKKIFGIPDHSA